MSPQPQWSELLPTLFPAYRLDNYDPCKVTLRYPGGRVRWTGHNSNVPWRSNGACGVCGHQRSTVRPSNLLWARGAHRRGLRPPPAAAAGADAVAARGVDMQAWCSVSNATIFDSADNKESSLAEYKTITTGTDCCRACVAMRGCRSWSVLPLLQMCQLRRTGKRIPSPMPTAQSGQLLI